GTTSSPIRAPWSCRRASWSSGCRSSPPCSSSRSSAGASAGWSRSTRSSAVARPSRPEVARPEPAPGTAPAPRVSVVVVNYNGAEALAGGLTALAEDREGPPAEILVVDNASEDGSLAIADRVAEGRPGVRVLRSTANRGYAGAVNLALPEARGDYVAVLNMDILVSPGWLEPLVAF